MPAIFPAMSSSRRIRVVMSRRRVPFRRSMMTPMPAVIRLNMMKLTIMPGELSVKPVGTWPAAAPARTVLSVTAGCAIACVASLCAVAVISV